ncbi:MAG: glutamine--fructose-6-phosphate transaminase (isomerizing) [Pegethrix bostrychoides GSE-TBD4-15B]|jgi:glucosamine--fructose-6-phosphate aminotransferase (isomerizing)|uniref:Glutamine--fructose-6-phosphate aminotransferase [isomerizing] n=1 Tax=Pegethrix bostrychoides GSE-TBD4-15B TaxID=2839662 RepID=A0A951U5R9_9CYAN|nr:glutamine--fructose-6-phosphate transaminase (isomerizing) [Pegethrix bostrychoides GSE-TBD4-15B]
MCGIVGYIGPQTASQILLAGLRKLEYRGYDSAGIAALWQNQIHRVRAKGKLQNLQDKLTDWQIPATLGIGHTRWATHGKPEEHNAHPHTDSAGRIAVVQNGIIENYRELREQLKAKGYQFHSETDTEVIPNLIAETIQQIAPDHPTLLLEAVRQAVNQLQGAFALAIISADFPNDLIAVRQQAPLSIGFGQGEFFCASDTPAMVAHTRTVLTLENGEIARLTPAGVEVYSFAGDRLRKTPRTLDWNPISVEKQGFKHFMLKEIYEQPGVVRAGLEAYLDSHWTAQSAHSPVRLGLPDQFYADLEQIQIVACGTSWHAALVGKHLLEQLAEIPTQVHYASEFRYAPTPLTPHTLTIGVTQSGETADTLSAMEMEKRRRAEMGGKFQPKLLGITNRLDGTISQVADYLLNTHAGIEIGVAATKTFTAQLVAFYCLALDLAHRRRSLPPERLEQIITELRQLPAQIESILEVQERYVEQLAHQFEETQDFIFIGRGINFPIALEGALKLKEISYIHAEGYPAGEMKHGPIALLDAKVPVVAIAMPGAVYEKVLSNAQEAKARDARLIGVTPMNDPEAAEVFDDLLPVPVVEELLSPLLTVIPLQFLAYHIAARRGLDVDQPRNLAKSVTVE